MRRMVRVRLHPIDGSIAQALIERLLMFEVTLCLDEKGAQRSKNAMQHCFRQELQRLLFPTILTFDSNSFPN